jgi:bifunctional UDP-N-acetylglucosamine pyrophosphorylase/glucosamine-1-phosphate N-acetyltransferase
MTARSGLARNCLAVVLAAGEGTRMRSSTAKVLHEVAGRSLLAHVLTAVAKAGVTRTAVVVGPGQDKVAAEAKRILPEAQTFTQHERRGTAHAVLAAKPALEKSADDILIVYGDTPLIRPETLSRLRAPLAQGAALVVLGFRPADPTGYGRLIMEGNERDGELLAIREEADASDAEKKITLCNGGIMAFAGNSALSILQKIGDANSKHEFYLTDAVEIARGMKLRALVVEAEEDDVRGINTKAQLAEAEAVAQRRLRDAAMTAGVTLIAPETVHLAADTKFGKDVVVEPYVVFGEKVTVDDGAVIRSFSHLAGAHVGKGAIVGPFARLRPGAELGEGAHIGNFVEIKAAVIEAGAKANHLSYIGDAFVGANANVGAGTITCNYDGTDKHQTRIGKGAFIGSNSALVAPVEIGDGAYIGSGSVITQNVPADALALGRGRQVVKEGWASRLRSLKLLGKKKA